MNELSRDLQLFQYLLERVALKFGQHYHPSSTNMTEWKGQDIIDFQEDLRAKTQSTVSEKWFYNYVKNSPKKLPRVDILNLLAAYAGYQNWNAFKADKANKSFKKDAGSALKKVYLGSALLLAVIGFLAYAFSSKSRTVYFCFLDADKKEPITEIPIDLVILKQGESPTYHKTDSLGCFSWETKAAHIRFIAKSPYHKTDTIYKSVHGDASHQVRLRTDDYALMLQYYAGNNQKDWKLRRAELNKLIADDAIIFELLPYQIGVELYTKKQFINKLSVPTPTLQKLKIIETAYRNGQVMKLKFKIAND